MYQTTSYRTFYSSFSHLYPSLSVFLYTICNVSIPIECAADNKVYLARAIEAAAQDGRTNLIEFRVQARARPGGALSFSLPP